MAKFDRGRFLFGLFLLPVIAIGSSAAHAINIPPWPAFIVMIFYFMSHMDKKQIPNIIVGSAFGILLIIPLGILIKLFGQSWGIHMVVLFFTILFVFAIIAFGEMLPIILNNYAFAAMLITGVEMTYVVKVHPFKLVAVELAGGLFFVYAIQGIVKLLTALAIRKMQKAKAQA